MRPALFALAVLTLSANASATKPTLRLERIDPSSFPSDGKVRVFASLVELEGQVDDSKQGFSLVVDGKHSYAAERVEPFRSTSLPLDLVLVIESSALYGVQKLPPPSPLPLPLPAKGKRKAVAPNVPLTPVSTGELPLDRVKEAMASLLESRGKKTRVLVVEYGGEVTPHPPFRVAQAASGDVDDLRPDDESGDLHLVDAVRAALLELGKPRNDADVPARRLIVVVSDGLNAQMERSTFRALGDAAAQARVPIHTIAFSPSDDRGPLLNLGEISKRSNGTFRWAKSADELKVQIDTLADELDKQYVLTFAPPIDALDGHTFQLRCEAMTSNVLRWEPGGGVFGWTGSTTRRSLVWTVLEWMGGILGALFCLYLAFAVVLRLATRGKGATLVLPDGRTISLSRKKTVLGKGKLIDDAAASTRHFTIGFDGRGWLVTDLGSTNGTWIDGVRLTTPQHIQANQTLQVGQTRLRFVVQRG